MLGVCMNRGAGPAERWDEGMRYRHVQCGAMRRRAGRALQRAGLSRVLTPQVRMWRAATSAGAASPSPSSAEPSRLGAPEDWRSR